MDVEKLVIECDKSIKDAIVRLDQNGSKFLMVSDHGILVGVVTDGDIRRWILKNGELLNCVTDIMNGDPKVLYRRDLKAAHKLMLEYSVECIPVLRDTGEIVDCITWKQVAGEERPSVPVETQVVIMAGGMGSRLLPYTKILPKPLIPIGEMPIVERIIQEFRTFGIGCFYMTVNYKKNMIKNYFSDISKEYDLEFVEEEKYLGTAGSLKYLEKKLTSPFFVSNCDILVYADYLNILEFHKENNNMITIVASLKNIKIPYGVIKIGNNESVINIEEKPEYDMLVNTGMYVLNPEVLCMIPEDRAFHMTDLIANCITSGQRVSTYPISESSWLDMGQIKEMEEMLRRVNF